MPEKILNSFEKGMIKDVDVLNQPPKTYRNSLNGRLVFNKDGTFSWENASGNRFSFNISPGYSLLGKAYLSDKVVLLSTNGAFSEIGFVTIDAYGNGIYTTVFNDEFDPNGDLLGFDLEHQI